jgi:hypothetical protein
MRLRSSALWGVKDEPGFDVSSRSGTVGIHEMKNIITGLISLVFLALVIGCGCRPDPTTANSVSNATPTPTSPAANSKRPEPAKAAQNSYRIKGAIDDAVQEGDVCDTTKVFTVPGTLKFEFKPSSPTKGEYTYSGPFKATGSGPYEIKSDGTMLVDGTGCIMGKCATYSHEWQAQPIEPSTCKDGNQ